MNNASPSSFNENPFNDNETTRAHWQHGGLLPFFRPPTLINLYPYLMGGASTGQRFLSEGYPGYSLLTCAYKHASVHWVMKADKSIFWQDHRALYFARMISSAWGDLTWTLWWNIHLFSAIKSSSEMGYLLLSLSMCSNISERVFYSYYKW